MSKFQEFNFTWSFVCASLRNVNSKLLLANAWNNACRMRSFDIFDAVIQILSSENPLKVLPHLNTPVIDNRIQRTAVFANETKQVSPGNVQLFWNAVYLHIQLWLILFSSTMILRALTLNLDCFSMHIQSSA